MASLTLWIGLALFAQRPPQPRPDPDQFPLALHRSMEIDDLDRELQRLRDTITLKKAQALASQRLYQRGLLSRTDLEREVSDVRYQEAREAESIAYRALKSYERDVLGQAVAQDEQKAYALLLDWVKKQGAIAQVEADFRGFELKQTRALYQRKAASREELEVNELSYNAALASVALARSREAQVLVELAARDGSKAFDPVEVHRLKTEHLKARVHYYEVSAEGAKRRLEIVTERRRAGLVPASDVVLFEKAAKEADETVTAQRKALAEHEATPAKSIPKPSIRNRISDSGRGPGSGLDAVAYVKSGFRDVGIVRD